MADYTTNLNLKQPGGDEDALISDINDNMTKIDNFAGSVAGYTIMSSGTDFNSLRTRSNYLVGNITQMSHYPTGCGSSGFLHIDNYSTYIIQEFRGNLGSAHRFSYDSGSTWVAWIDMSKRVSTPIELTASLTPSDFLDGLNLVSWAYTTTIDGVTPGNSLRGYVMKVGTALYGVVATAAATESYFIGYTNNAWFVRGNHNSYYVGNNTLTNVQSALYNYGSNRMSDGSSTNISFNITEVYGIFGVTGYIGELKRISASRFVVNLRQSMTANFSIIGNYKDGTWYWDRLALNSAIHPSISEYGVRMITYHTPTNPPGSVNGFKFNVQSVAYTWGSFIVYTRYGIHTINFSVDGAMNIGVRTSKIDSFNSEALTATVSNRTVTVTSSIGWNYFAFEGRSTQAGDTFDFNYTQES